MKLDATDLRYVTSDEFRVLTAVRLALPNVLDLVNKTYDGWSGRNGLKKS